MLGGGVEGVPQLLAVESILEALDDGLVAGAVVDDGVAFAAVDQGLDEGAAAPGHGDDGVDIGEGGELDRVGAHGCGAAVDDERRGGFGGRPGVWEA